jgi:hypothetical protein
MSERLQGVLLHKKPSWMGRVFKKVLLNGLEVRENWSFPVWSSMDLELVGALL